MSVQALVVRLVEGNGVNANNAIISGVLVTVGDLARVVRIVSLFFWDDFVFFVLVFFFLIRNKCFIEK